MMATEFISRKLGTEGYEVIIKTDDEKHYETTVDFARGLIDHAKPMTNADRIRAMTDDELAEMIIGVSHGVEPCNYCEPTFGQECGMTSVCKDGVMNWLRMPAEG